MIPTSVARVALAARLVVSALLLQGGLVFALNRQAASAFATTGNHDVVRLAIGWTEAIAALLFMVPAALRIGGVLLLTVLAAAMLIHVALHQFRADLVVGMMVVVLLVTIERNRHGAF